MQRTTESARRWPAEWEPQAGVMLCWPHAGSDWLPWLAETERVYARIVREIARAEQVLVIARADTGAPDKISAAGADMRRVTCVPLDSDDTWARDFGPITVLENGAPALLDFEFNGWGGKFRADQDNALTRGLAAAGRFPGIPVYRPGLVLEGGSVESDGGGTILTTTTCLLTPTRNPRLTRGDIEAELKRWLGASRILWLENGALRGDDTDSHIDTLARFAPEDTILYVACDDPADEQYAGLRAMEAELRSLRTCAGAPYRLAALPCPRAVYDEAGERLPATYANFLAINGAVLCPVYGDAADEVALATIARAFPGRTIVPIDCSVLIRQHGSLHCITMQLPKGVRI